VLAEGLAEEETDGEAEGEMVIVIPL